MTAAGVVNAVVNADAVQPFGLSSLPCPEQLEMMRDPATGALPRASIAAVRGRGRPKGAVNKRNRKIADLFVQRFGDPLMALGELASTPLRQLVEVLIEAEGGEEREEKLLAAVDAAVEHIKSLRAIGGSDERVGRDMADRLADAIEGLERVVAQLNGGKPGKLALDALSLQLQARFKALEYVHGKQPIAVDIRRQADVVVVAPELLKEHGIDPAALANAIAERGIEALTDDSLRITDGEFSPVEDDAR